MSYILDALRRSEQQRRRLEADSSISAIHLPAAGERRWLPWVLSGALLLNGALLGWLLLQKPLPPPPPSSTPVADHASDFSPPTLLAAPSPPLPALADVTGRPLRPVPLTVAPSPAEPAAAAPPTVPVTSEPEPPGLAELPESFRRSLPAIEIGMHVYAAQPAARFVLINDHRYREGQDISAGLHLERITVDGLVLRHQGQRFRLARR